MGHRVHFSERRAAPEGCTLVTHELPKNRNCPHDKTCEVRYDPNRKLNQRNLNTMRTECGYYALRWKSQDAFRWLSNCSGGGNGRRSGSTGEEQPPPADAKRRLRGKPLGFAITLVVALAIFAGVGLLFHAQTYASPAGTLVAKDVGTVTVGGVTLKHVTLAFNTYPDASGSVNGVPIHPGGNPSWPSYGPTNQYQVPAHSLVTVTIRQYDSGGALNNPWFDKVRGTVGGIATVNGKVVTLHQSEQRRPHLHRPGHAWHRSRDSSSTSRCRSSRGTARPITESTRPSSSASFPEARASTPGTASSRAGRRLPPSEGR